MSDTTEETPSDKKKSAAPSDKRPGEQTEPVPKDLDLFLWIEELFAGAEEYPEKIDCCPASGRQHEKLGMPIKQQTYPPAKEQKKPGREALVNFANKLVHTMQMDCDVQRRELVYSINAWHFSRDSDPYARFIRRMKPSGKFAGYSDAEPRDEEEEQQDQSKKFGAQVLAHHETMFGLYGGGVEGLLDRCMADNARKDATIERLQARIEKLTDMLEKALSLEAERANQAKWNELKIRSAEMAFEKGMTLVPPVLNMIQQKLGSGQPQAGGAIAETFETVTIKAFLESMPAEQLDAVCGRWDENRTLVEPGVLTKEQAIILADVAYCKISADRLNDLMPGGEHAVTGEQLAGLGQCGLGMAQMAPLQLIFEARTKRRQG